MRRQLLTRVLPGVAAAALLLGAGAAGGQSTHMNATLEIAESAGTGVIGTAVQGLTLAASSSVSATARPAPLPKLRADRIGAGSADGDYTASINTIDDFSVIQAGAEPQSDRSTGPRETGNNLILAQYN